ncbi:Dolichyl-phosphate beta-glucosyltransferase [Aphelenchoides besseyi]|nr:Dolichyl-phosphate beta-glucosyltransferase [Aphelenchoides besseyi]
MLTAELFLFALVCLPGAAVLVLYLMLYYNTSPRRSWEYMIRQRSQYSLDGKEHPFELLLENKNVKTISDLKATESSLSLSVVVPAMNESLRLPTMLGECLEFLEKKKEDSSEFTYEVIVVDDGSTDDTATVAYEFGYNRNVRVLKLDRNLGKGGAVRNGVLCARGALILFADADGATRFSDLEKLELALKKSEGGDSQNDLAVAIGSRAHLEKTSIAQRSLFRTFLMVGFHALVYMFAVRSVRDTQCGFKLFTRKAAAQLFPRIHVERWAFDVELLYLAERLGISVTEVAVEWHEVEGSKITPLLTSIEMGRDILLIWFRYYCNFWRIDDLKISQSMPPRRVKREVGSDVEPQLQYQADHVYMEEELMTNTHDGEFVRPSRLKEYLKKITVDIVAESADKMELEFDLVHVEAPIANALRRVLLAEVPTVAIEKIYLYQNTSCIPDEVLCHRIGLIPLNVDPRLFKFPSEKFVPIVESDEVETEPPGNPKEHVILNFHVKCTKNKQAPADTTNPKELFVNHYALSDKFIWEPIGDQQLWLNNVSTVHKDIVVAKLRPGQEIEARCHCVKGVGKDHAKFSPVATASYRLLPSIQLKREVKGKSAELLKSCFSPGVIEVIKEKGEQIARVIDARNDMCSRNVFRFDELKDAVELTKKKDHFIFSVESTGALESHELVVEACRIIQDKSNNLLNMFCEKLSLIMPTPVQ